MVSSYTANLAMFLVVENKTSKIYSVEDLKDCGNEGGECPVKFGAKEGGATFSFFKVIATKSIIVSFIHKYAYSIEGIDNTNVSKHVQIYGKSSRSDDTK